MSKSDNTYEELAKYKPLDSKKDSFQENEQLNNQFKKLDIKSTTDDINVNKHTEELNQLKRETKAKLNNIIDKIDNGTLISIFPCYLESFINDPEISKDNINKLELINENKKLKSENERLQLAIINMENKNLRHAKTDCNKDEHKIPPETKNIGAAVEEKLNNMTVKPKRMLFRKKNVVKEGNVYLVPYTKKTFYQLRWNKAVKKENIWETINKQLNYEMLTHLFPPDDLSCYEKKLKITKSTIKIMQPVKTVFPPKKGQAISIALGRVKITDKKMKEHIFQLNDSVFSENLIKQLVKNHPTKNEFDLLKNLKMELETKYQIVGRAEQFYIEFISCHENLYKYLTAINFKLAYPSNAQIIRDMITKLTKIYNRALESTALKEFCSYTLFLGNIFNNNTFLGNAEGYTFDSITTFIEYTGNNKEKLIDDIINKMQYDLIADLKYITGENIKYESLCMQFADVSADYNLLSLTDILETYLKSLIEDYNKLKIEYNELNILYARFSKYFNGENIFNALSFLLNAIQKR